MIILCYLSVCLRFILILISLRIHCRFLTIFFKKSKKAYEVMLLDMEKYIHTESLLFTLYIEIQNAEITEEINVTKNALFFYEL